MRLKELRKSKGISQEQAANELEISVRAYQNYEYGQREPNIEMINKLADLYNVTTDYLLGREPKPPDSPIDAFAKGASLKELEKILIERYLELPDKQREAVLEFMRSAIAEEAKRKAADPKNIKLVMKAARDGESPGMAEITDEEEAMINDIPDIGLDYFSTP